MKAAKEKEIKKKERKLPIIRTILKEMAVYQDRLANWKGKGSSIRMPTEAFVIIKLQILAAKLKAICDE